MKRFNLWIASKVHNKSIPSINYHKACTIRYVFSNLHEVVSKSIASVLVNASHVYWLWRQRKKKNHKILWIDFRYISIQVCISFNSIQYFAAIATWKMQPHTPYIETWFVRVSISWFIASVCWIYLNEYARQLCTLNFAVSNWSFCLHDERWSLAWHL